MSGGQAAVAVEPAEKVRRGAFAFERVAFRTRRDEVAIGIAAGLHARYDVIEALIARADAAEAIKTAAALAGVDGLAQGLGLEEIQFFEVDGTLLPSGVAGVEKIGAQGGKLLGYAHFDHVTGFGAFDQAQNAEVNETADGGTRGAVADASAAGEPGHGKAEAEFAFEAAVAQEMRIDGAVGGGEAQSRDEMVLELFPDK